MAEASVGMHPEFATNIEALKKVMPKDLTANEIGIKIRCNMDTDRYYRQFYV